MTRLIVFCLWISLFVLSGCATNKQKSWESFKTAGRSVAHARSVSRDRNATPADVSNASDTSFADVMQACSETLSPFQRRSQNLQYAKLAVAVLGGFAGSIAIPALTTANAAGNKIWISALGGISGMANLSQQALTEEGLTSSNMLNIRQDIIDKVNAALADYYANINNPLQTLAPLQRALAACHLYRLTIEPSN